MARSKGGQRRSYDEELDIAPGPPICMASGSTKPLNTKSALEKALAYIAETSVEKKTLTKPPMSVVPRSGVAVDTDRRWFGWTMELQRTIATCGNQHPRCSLTDPLLPSQSSYYSTPEWVGAPNRPPNS